MSEYDQHGTFDRRVMRLWAGQGYEVTVREDGLLAIRGEETRLLETFPDGELTSDDIETAVSRLIESTELTHVMLVVGGDVPDDLREEVDEWDVTVVDGTELRGMARSGDDTVVLGADDSLDPSPSDDQASATRPEPGTGSGNSHTGTERSTDWAVESSAPEPTAAAEAGSNPTTVRMVPRAIGASEEPVPGGGEPSGASEERVASTLQRYERRTVAREAGALVLEVVLVALLAGTLGYLAVQLAALV